MKSYLKSLAVATIAVASLLTAPAAPAADVTQSVDIVKSTIWTKDNTYWLNNVIYVLSNSTLTIEAGTVVRGLPDSETPGGTENPGALLIARGSKIKALGTEAEPVIFTDKSDDNVPGGAHSNTNYNQYARLTAQWGGLVVLGKTFIAVNSTGPTNQTFQAEGVTAHGSGDGLYGGADDDDDSGILRYVSIRYGGFALAPASEINGITLCGVGRETVIDHIDIYNTQDDGIEFFGGTVNTKYICIWNCGDDSYDQDQGYRGKNQFIFVVKGDPGGTAIGSGIGDKGMELDGGEADYANAQPWGLAATYNVTIVGKGLQGLASNGVDIVSTYFTKARDTAVHMKANYGGQFYNSLFLDFGGGGVIMENRNPTNDVVARFNMVYTNFTWAVNTNFASTAYLYPTQTRGWQVELRNNGWWQFGDLVNPVLTQDVARVGGSVAGVTTLTNNPDFFFEPDGVTSTLNTNLTAQPIVFLERGTNNTDGVFTAIGRNLQVRRIDPRPVTSVVPTSTLTPPCDGFYTPVTYIGAFSPTNNWCAGWTLPSQLGLITNTFPNPSAPTALIAMTSSNATVSFATVSGLDYSVESSPDMKHWSPDCPLLTGNGSTTNVVDPNALSSRYFYRVVVP